MISAKTMNQCNSCSQKVSALKNFGSYPIVNKLLDSKEKDTEKFEFILGICNSCELTQIINPIDLDKFYTNYLTPSTHKPNPHASKLIKKLSDLVSPSAKIVDVGCNDGTFLELLKENGFTNLFGIEPTLNTHQKCLEKKLDVTLGFLDQLNASRLIKNGLFDLVVTRQVLEHIPNLKEFGSSLRTLLKPSGYLVIEVPNAGQNISSPDYSLWEEHVNYFTPLTLENYLNSIGFEIVDQWNSTFSGTCLSVIAKKVERVIHTPKDNLKEIDSWISWANNFDKFKEKFTAEIRKDLNNKELILYGVGARSQFLCNIVGIDSELVFAIDDSSLKQNRYMANSNIKIISSEEALKNYFGKEFLVLLGVNAENEERLINESPFINKNKFLSILPPSPHLPTWWK
jgi:2-polyprenyl-3-methyl-5-hydroxy-6-metoxy-1,4-benzoquinol methylase